MRSRAARRSPATKSLTPLPPSFYDRDPLEVAPELLNKLLVRTEEDGTTTIGRIVEVEAYCGRQDPGSHAFRGETPRTRTMFGPPGGLYVYFTYGMHWCANAVCCSEGTAGAVLLRALAPLCGLDLMRARRGRAVRSDRDLCSGPAKLCQALGLDRRFDGSDLTASGSPVSIVDDGTGAPSRTGNTTRIGLNAGAEHPWRWYVIGDPNVSRGALPHHLERSDVPPPRGRPPSNSSIRDPAAWRSSTSS